MFIGREKELAMLEAEYKKDDYGCIILYGRRRVGKTALINEFCKDLDIPVIKDFPYGHIPSRVVLPIGVPVRLDADNCRLTYL